MYKLKPAYAVPQLYRVIEDHHDSGCRHIIARFCSYSDATRFAEMITKEASYGDAHMEVVCNRKVVYSTKRPVM